MKKDAPPEKKPTIQEDATQQVPVNPASNQTAEAAKPTPQAPAASSAVVQETASPEKTSAPKQAPQPTVLPDIGSHNTQVNTAPRPKKKLAKPKKDKATNNEKVNNALFNSKEPIYYTRKGERTGLSIYFWLWQRFMLNINEINALLEHFKENKQYLAIYKQLANLSKNVEHEIAYTFNLYHETKTATPTEDTQHNNDSGRFVKKTAAAEKEEHRILNKEGLDSLIALLKYIIDQCKQTLSQYEWKDKKMLLHIQKKLQYLIDSAESYITQLKEEIAKDKEICDRLLQGKSIHEDKPANQITIYVSLYQASGNQIQVWEQLIRGIGLSSSGRAVYTQEKAVRKLIQSKQDPINEGYIIASINKNDIIAGKGKQQDIIGQDIIYLRQGCISPSNIERFIHANEHVYQLIDNSLKKVDDNE